MQDELRRKARKELEGYCSRLSKTINDQNLTKKLTADEKKIMRNIINNPFMWIDMNTKDSQEAFEQKTKELIEICSPLLDRIDKGETPGDPGETVGRPLQKVNENSFSPIISNMIEKSRNV
ncbi:unnamed protein product [Didymodactylos carnosus]|uniref:Uncharacterized protein n=1 Tax=Didymodactylos carnosus TaxID=1234261 RepID=A0A815A0Z6_9BILA|nr:unnamed protein product [Didymodactylos carnosus]CAF1362396.1 unnamed protein product [Didymodactylos carnosus]CAF4017205.1 unnamed protein product [Didymodactylos carnosus]CAF4172211.1 unnamed protein product [Didymodactylos carnosus]